MKIRDIACVLAVLWCVTAVPLAQRGGVAAGDPGTVLITGSNRGLGLEFVRQYAAAGWRVFATARDPQGATELRDLAARNPRITTEPLDVTNEVAIEALAAKYRGTPIDVLLNNAGVLGDMKAQAPGGFEYDEFEQVMAVNVFAPLAIADAFKEHVAASRQKKIVFANEPLRDHLPPWLSGPVVLPRQQDRVEHGDARARRRCPYARNHRGARVAAAHRNGHAQAADRP